MKKYFVNNKEVDKKTFIKTLNHHIDELALMFDSQALAYKLKCALADFEETQCFELDDVKFEIK